MDYNARHGTDVASFDLPCTYISNLLEEVDARPAQFISTGLEPLDESLRNARPGSHGFSHTGGGIEKGQMTEVWGPPGAGKTALGIQLAANVMCEGSGAVWVDCFHPVCSERLGAVFDALQRRRGEVSGYVEKFTHYTCASLAHFIALVCRPPDTCVPSGTSIIVIDSLSALVNHAFPKIPEPKASDRPNGNKELSVSARRKQTLQYIVGALKKLAASRNVAVLVLTQCASKLQTEQGAALVPAISGQDWEQSVPDRLVVFRDWIWEGDHWKGVHFVGIQKLSGKGADKALGDIIPFTIQHEGLAPVKCDAGQPPVALPMTASQKRREVKAEIPDSDDEEYGWHDEDDNAVPPMPSQWQGSEDLLLGQHVESEGEGDQADGDGTNASVAEDGSR